MRTVPAPSTRALVASAVIALSLLATSCSSGPGNEAADAATVGESPEPPPTVEPDFVPPRQADVACGSPDVDPAIDAGLFVWQDCDAPEWNFLLTGEAGADGVFAFGRVFSELGIIEAVPRSLEAGDVLNTDAAESSTYFMLSSGNPWADGFRVSVPPGSELCIDIAEGPPVYVGPDRLAAGMGRIDPVRLGTCRIPPQFDDCTDPRVDTTIDSGLFVWKSCYGYWVVQLTGTRPDGGLVSALGTFSTSAARFDTIVPRFVESSDSVTEKPGPHEPIRFGFRTINPWSDRLYVASFGDADLCVTIESISEGVGIFAGGDRTPVARQFDPATLGPCR